MSCSRATDIALRTYVPELQSLEPPDALALPDLHFRRPTSEGRFPAGPSESQRNRELEALATAERSLASRVPPAVRLTTAACR